MMQYDICDISILQYLAFVALMPQMANATEGKRHKWQISWMEKVTDGTCWQLPQMANGIPMANVRDTNGHRWQMLQK